MKSVGELLRSADPVRHEGPWSPQQRLTVQRRALAGPPRPGPAQGARRGFILALATVCVTAVTALVVVSRFSSPALHAARHFEVRLAEDHSAPGLREARVAGSEHVVYLHEQVVVTNGDIARSSVITGDASSQFVVSVEFTAEGSEKMRQATANHIGRPLAILIDGEVVSAPVLRSPISRSAAITGSVTRAEAERIVNGITLR